MYFYTTKMSKIKSLFACKSQRKTITSQLAQSQYITLAPILQNEKTHNIYMDIKSNNHS
jgi:hypothetical protein